MHSNRLSVRSFLKVLGLAALTLTAVSQAQAADASGTWTWSTAGRNGGAERKFTLKLKEEGTKLTGTLSTPGRGGQARDVQIEEGKVTGDQISFTITREFNGNKFVQKYTGKISGDTLKGNIEMERNGNTRKIDWEAKRAKA